MANINTEINNKNRSILIIDDDSFLLDMYALRFTQANFIVEIAMSSNEVIDKLKGGLNPDIMLIDVVMPTVDGFELLERVNSEKLALNTTKVYLSNLGQEQDIERGKSLGAEDYIVKAKNTPSEVVTRVLDILKKHGL